MKLFIGVDPGQKGALAFLRGTEAWVEDMPTYPYFTTTKGKTRRAVDLGAVRRLIAPHVTGFDHSTAMMVLERVHSMPGQGVASAFSFGMAFWGVAGVAAGLQIPVELVTPGEWKKHYKLGKDKAGALGLAARLYPSVDLGGRDGRAEALLLARWLAYRELL